jgi:glucose/mannose-6-phosphate isomerase
LAALGANFVLGDVRVELERGIAHLRALRKSLRSDVRLRSNRAKSLAVRLRNRIPVFYAAPPYGPIARRWQTQFNENAKAIAFTSSFPEADHNELVGWSADSRARSLVPVFLRDFDESSEIRRRLDASASLFSRWTQVEQVRDRGKTLLDRMLGLLYLGDFTSLYLAVLRKVDPLPVAPIEQLKARLKR